MLDVGQNKIFPIVSLHKSEIICYNLLSVIIFFRSFGYTLHAVMLFNKALGMNRQTCITTPSATYFGNYDILHPILPA